eukprot:6183290-Pleurochrysis_carterae.AAC.6
MARFAPGLCVRAGMLTSRGSVAPSPSFECVHMTEPSVVASRPAIRVVHACVWPFSRASTPSICTSPRANAMVLIGRVH